MRKMAFVFVVLAGSAATFTTMADERHHPAGGTVEKARPPLTDGEVRKVDKDAKKITLRHGPLPQLDMPMQMTMVYLVKDPSMLDRVKAGDKVKFEAQKIGGAFTLTKIEPAK